ncbi:MAG: hypothetical protein JWL69_2540 [Phycisphaerales bacterium]|nr:hypothetical protein [Phycisphaerales bacterium]MDB5356849.1 hypothetical protein [Phycisphaerales bacterium]
MPIHGELGFVQVEVLQDAADQIAFVTPILNPDTSSGFLSLIIHRIPTLRPDFCRDSKNASHTPRNAILR